MAWWPFGRQKKKAKKIDVRESEKHTLHPQQQHVLQPPTTPIDRVPFRRTFLEKPPTAAPQTPQSPRRALTAPSEEDITALPRSPRKIVDITATPPPPPPLSPIPDPGPNAASPTFLSEPKLFRNKSSKRHPDERLREQQLRAMSPPIPTSIRSGADSPQLLRRDSKKRKSDFNKRFQDPSSNSSLPRRSMSVRSSMTGFTESHRFDVGGVDILSPRPTLRYSLQSQYGHGGATSLTGPSRVESNKETIGFASGRSSKENGRGTIDEYADAMDNRTLREIMEREQRRKERKRRNDEARARRKLERYASSRDSEGRTSSRRQQADPFADQAHAAAGPSGLLKEYVSQSPSLQTSPNRTTAPHNPFADPTIQAGGPAKRYTPLEEIYSVHERSVPHVGLTPSPTASPLPHRRPPSDRTKDTDSRARGVQDVSDVASFDKRDSGMVPRRQGTLSAMFRRSGIGKRVSVPSEQSFSNTSRESMSRQPLPSSVHERTYRRVSTGAPMRTKSKFREDLPESPLSPPHSRVQSPASDDYQDVPPLPVHHSDSVKAFPQDSFSPQPTNTHNNPYGSAASPSAAMMSQSLASVDSEASWLSGGLPRKRASQPLSIGRSSLVQRASAFDVSAMDDIDQTYVPEEEGDGEENIVQGAVARQATVVYRSPRITSSTGSLRHHADETNQRLPTPSETDDYYETASETASQGAPDDPMPEPATGPTQLEHATQAYGLQHVRSISAGSARLLDIPARRESWRNSGRDSMNPC